MRKTKIVCTLGPASSSEETLRQMLLSGMNVARINFSHGTHEEHKVTIERFRKVRDELGVPAAVLLDTKGPEIRVGVFEKPVVVTNGQKYTFTTEECPCDDKRAYVNYAGLPHDVSVGTHILVNDGAVAFQVDSVEGNEIHCTVIDGGKLSSRKGVNVPGVHLEMPFLSDRDKSDLLFGIEMGVDFVAASFTRRPEDVMELKEFLEANGGKYTRIIAKIENTEGVEKFDEILALADGIMVARGDLGVEVPFEQLPGLQKRFIRCCYQAGKMVITATQMLDSMEEHSRPTRAEISDVANAVYDGTSAIMLSGETAAGMYPVQAVATMAAIAAHAEEDAMARRVFLKELPKKNGQDITSAISAAACTTAEQLDARAIIAETTSGKAARRVSKFRPRQMIIAATPKLRTYHQLALCWGVYPLLVPTADTMTELLSKTIVCAKEKDLLKRDDIVVLTGGLPLNTRGSTNMLQVKVVE